MNAVASAKPRQLPVVQRFVRTPKGTLLLILALITAIATLGEGPERVVPGVVGAVLVAALLDVALARIIRKVLIFPDGAILTGLIVALVLSPTEPLYVPVCTAALAIVSKYLFRTRWSNVFNPAALALVASSFIFGSGQSWWGALPDLSPVAVVVIGGTGLYITNRLNKLPLVLVFLGGYFTLFTVTSFLVDPAVVSEIFRSPDANATLFFALFMLDDPPTSPVRYLDQVRFSLIVAFVSFLTFLTVGSVYYLLAGLLAGNAWEAWRRVGARPGAATA